MASIDYSYWMLYPEGQMFDQYKHYLTDKSKIEYGASLLSESVNRGINRAAGQIVGSIDRAAGQIVGSIDRAAGQITGAIGELSNTVVSVGNRICAGLQDVNNSLASLNRRADIMIEQQRMSNLLLQNIAELLKVPNSEKERQQAITNGIRFLSNASIGSDLYSDALEEFLKAEEYQKQDYFVLHRIGCIYLYSEANLDPVKAYDYFARAAKYAKVESDPNAVRMANLLTNQINRGYTQTISNTNSILRMAADSFEKAAFAAYVANDLPRAIECQQKANELQPSPQGLFFLSKYESHENNMDAALPLLKQAVDGDANMAVAVFQEVDMMVRPEIVNYIDNVEREVSDGLNDILHYLDGKMNTDALAKVTNDGSFVERMQTLKRYRRKLNLQ